VRTEKVGDATERREEFTFAETQTRFEQKMAEDTIAAVQWPDTPVASRKSQTGVSARTVRIEAVVGRDRRYLTSPSTEGKGKT
jgi:hypothetical protein